MPIVIGESGWPTDGDKNENLNFAQQFNQGFMDSVISNKGTPLHPGYVDAFLFSLIDEEYKSIQPGNFERHWGLFYPSMQSAWGWRIQRFWYQQGPSVSYACVNAGCTGLGYGTSCEKSGWTGQHLLCI